MTYTLPERNAIMDALWNLQDRNNLPISTVVGRSTAHINAELTQLRKQFKE